MVLSFGFVGWQLFLILTGSLNPGAVASGETLTNSKGFWLLTALPGLWFLAEVLTMLTNDKRRALHDFIAGTVVVRTNTEGSIAQQQRVYCCEAKRSQQIRHWLNKPGRRFGTVLLALVFAPAGSGKTEAEVFDPHFPRPPPARPRLWSDATACGPRQFVQAG